MSQVGIIRVINLKNIITLFEIAMVITL